MGKSEIPKSIHFNVTISAIVILWSISFGNDQRPLLLFPMAVRQLFALFVVNFCVIRVWQIFDFSCCWLWARNSTGLSCRLTLLSGDYLGFEIISPEETILSE